MPAMAATQILPAQQTDGQLFHQPGPRRSSPSSSNLFLANSPPTSLSSSPKPQSVVSQVQHRERVSEKIAERVPTPPPQSSTDSSPRSSTDGFSHTSSFNSTPRSSGLSLDETLEDEDDDINFPDYNSLQLSIPDSSFSKPSSRHTDDENDVPEISTTTDTTRSDSPLPTPTVADDTMIKEEPSRHVDYLSHDWREEDIWSSWRHIVSQRKVYGQKSRLENASWRTWAKSKYRLRTVSPEKLNWLKESDVTWLYGPLQPAQSHPITSDTSTPPSNLSKSSSFINKKPILKKRSMSEVMLQKSISASSLVKQAAASVQAQNGKQPKRNLSKTNFEIPYTPSIPPSQPPSRDDDYFSRRASTTEADTPSEGGKEKHIRFDEVVEQCVAVDVREPGFDYEDDPEADDHPSSAALSESSSDEGLLMMKRKKEVPRRDSNGKGKLSRSNSSSKMIETIPATTLKYRTDSPDVTEEAQHHVFGKNWSAGKLSPSPSQETLRPSRPSRNFLLADDEDDDNQDDTQWSFGASNPSSSLGASANAVPSSSRGRPDEYNPTDGFEGLEGMRRTESGMFMPIDEDEDDMVAAGLFGRVSETVNTVKDIGWVLWNVGWRK